MKGLAMLFLFVFDVDSVFLTKNDDFETKVAGDWTTGTSRTMCH